MFNLIDDAPKGIHNIVGWRDDIISVDLRVMLEQIANLTDGIEFIFPMLSFPGIRVTNDHTFIAAAVITINLFQRLFQLLIKIQKFVYALLFHKHHPIKAS